MSPRVPSAPSAYPRADQRAGDDVGPNRLGGTDRLCETLSSWRLLVGGLSPGASHHSFTTSSEEPPLSNFNSYRDIPVERDGVEKSGETAVSHDEQRHVNPIACKVHISDAGGLCPGASSVPDCETLK